MTFTPLPSAPDSPEPSAPRPRRKALAGRVPARPSAPETSLTVEALVHYVDGWLVACEASMHSPQTLATRRLITNNLLWFLRRQRLPSCGLPELRSFFAYLVHGHAEAGGRWGNPQLTRPVRPGTVKTYHSHLRAFFSWAVKEGALATSPVDRIDRPVCRADQIQPFSDDQVGALLAAARRTQNARRDETIVWMLFDTGVRASELCGLRRRDLDMTAKKITVRGKGDKTRSVYFGTKLAKALWMYLGQGEWDPECPLFSSERARDKGHALHRYGLRDLIERLGEKSGIGGVRCSAHTFRHTHALSYLRCGGSVEGLKERLGHEDIKMTLKYVALAEADMAGQRRFSPGDRLPSRALSTPAPKPPEKVLPLKPPPLKHSRAKLTEDDVREAKGLLRQRVPRKEIAARLGVSVYAVKEIALGYSWRHID